MGLTLKLLGLKLKVTGKEFIPKTGSFLIISNHLSFLDPTIIGITCLPRALTFLAREDLFKGFFFSNWMRAVDVLPLKRDQADLSTIKTVIDLLKKGKPVAIFPEGTRQRRPEDSFKNIKRGFFLIAKKAHVPVLVAKIYGSEKALGKDTSAIKRNIEVRVAFSKPFIIESDEKYEQALKHLEQALAQL